KKLLLVIGLCGPLTLFGQVNVNQAPATQVQLLQPTSISKNQLQLNGISGSATSTVISPLNSNSGHSCKSHELNEAHFAAQGILNDYNQSYYDGVAAVNPVAIDKTPGVNTISVIFHVVHNPNNPAENVSNALIMQVFNEL